MSVSGRARGLESLCVRECLRFARRHRRYFLIFLTLYWHSLRGWNKARAARYGYCFLQLFDDIMDGDRRTEVAPTVIAERTIAAWTSGRFDDDEGTIARLGAAFHEALSSLPVLAADDPRHDVLVLLRAMHADARRVAARRLLTRAQLAVHLRSTFHHSLNILLVASRLRTRAAQVPDLVEALGWCSVVRDLEDDLKRGLVNIPGDVMALVPASDRARVSGHPAVTAWLADEKIAARQHLARSSITLKAIARDEPSAGRLLGVFQRSVERYAR